MTRTFYEKVNEYYAKNIEINNRNSFIDTILQSYKLSLEIIDNKNDDEFGTFFDKYMKNYKFSRNYFHYVKRFDFNSFQDANDFIDKIKFINDGQFYKDLNTFLNDIVIINQKLKKEEQEKLKLIKKEEQEKLELRKKEEQGKIKAMKKTIKKEVVNEVKEISSKQTKPKKETITEDTDKKKKKKPISATIKRLVWNTNIGEDVGKYKCMCCNSTDITQMSFNCGHIVAEANGGETIVSNLKPICQNCNSSMGIKNMEDFMKSLK